MSDEQRTTARFLIDVGTDVGIRCSRCDRVAEYKVRDLTDYTIGLESSDGKPLEEWEVITSGTLAVRVRGCRICLQKLIAPELDAIRKEEAMAIK